ncbi:MAG: hypothetical protein KGZ25_00235 [Planctomycetes bacterium]|nr:hypothetical protein [Planctomycetota bacterium]
MFKNLRQLIFGNAVIKLIALAIAVALWFYANNRLKEEANLRVPVVVDVPEGYELVYQSHNRVQIRFSGPQYLIQRRQEEANQNFLQMTGRFGGEEIKGGLRKLPIQGKWLNIPATELVQMGIQNVKPEALTVYISPVESRTLPVEILTSGRPREGYEIRGKNSIPEEVVVQGPRVSLNEMSAIMTHPISVWDARSDLRRVVPLVKQRKVELAEGLEVSTSVKADPPQVAAYVEVAGQDEERVLEGLPVQIVRPLSFPYGVKIPEEESHATVVLRGLSHQLDRVEPEGLMVYVDLRTLTEEKIEPGGSALYKERIHVLPPDEGDVEVIRTEPQQVTVELSNKVE